MPTVSVIIPTFNRAPVLTRALESVARQGFRDWEILVADDGSTDATPQVVSRFAARNGQTRYLPSSENRGVSAARNRAAREAEGSWLAFLDSDDEWLPHKLERQLQAATDSDLPLVHSDEIWVRNGVRVNAMKKHAKSGGRIFKRCVDLCCISPSAALIRRSVFEQLGGFREDFPVCEDYDLWLRLCARSEVAFVTEPLLIKYGGHEDQLSHRFKAMDYYRAKALLPFLDDGDLTREEHAHAAQILLQKCEILLKGYRKHGNLSHVDEVEGWALRARTHVQSAHSTAERWPRSESNFTL